MGHAGMNDSVNGLGDLVEAVDAVILSILAASAAALG
jgi:hypothetical protein